MQMHRTLKGTAAGALTLLAAASVRAHDGHGLAGGHWHVSDTWGFMALAAVVALAIWSSRGGK